MNKEILVVDDQPGIQLLLKDVLINEGYNVTTAKTGQEALDHLYRHPFDLIILDYRLPVIDGAQVLKQLEMDGIHIPSILMSGLIEGLEIDMKSYRFVKEVVAKPFNVLEFCEMVKSILDS
ncbi:MAG TPA: response regulator [Bacillota bacterium]|nr:response regulator [Bacillota bacterium]